MADEKVSQLDEIQNLASSDLLYLSQDQGGGSYVSKSIQTKNFNTGTIIYLTYDGSTGTATGTLGVTKNLDGDWSVTLPGMYYIDTTGGNITIRLPDSDADNENQIFSFRKPNLTLDDYVITFRTENGTQTLGPANRYYMFQSGESVEFIAVNFVGSGAAGRKWRQTVTEPKDKYFTDDLNAAGSPYTINNPYGLYLADTSAGDVVVNLGPITVANDDKTALFLVTDSTNNLIINADTGSGDTIGGKASQALNEPNQALAIIANIENQIWYLSVDTRTAGLSNTVYVSKTGSDTYGDGSFNNPYLTIKFANDSIIDNSAFNRYNVVVSSGLYIESPIVMKEYVDIRALGGPYSTQVIAANANAPLFTTIGTNTLSGFTISSVTNNAGYLASTQNKQSIIKDCVIYNCKNCIEASMLNAEIIVINLASVPIGSITNIIYAHNGGRIIGTGMVIPTGVTIENIFYANGVGSYIDYNTIESESSNVVNGIHANNGAKIRIRVGEIEGATHGVYLETSGPFTSDSSSSESGDLSSSSSAVTDSSSSEELGTETSVIVNSFRFDECNVGVRGADSGTIQLFSCLIVDSIQYDVLIDDLPVHFDAVGCAMRRSKISYPNGYQNDICFFQDDAEGDEALVVFGELAVGRPEHGTESIFGEGDSYVRGMVVITTDNTATSTTEGSNLTDVSAIAATPSGSTFSFQGVGANNTILIGSTLQNGTDFLKHWGLKMSQTTAAVEVTPKSFVFEYWNGSTWTECNVMATESNLYYRYANEIFIRANSSEQIRYGLTNDVTGVDWTKKTIDSKNLYWTRIRIATTVTTAPVFEQFKLHSSRFEANPDGTNTYHGNSRFRQTIASGGNSFGESGGVNNWSLTVGSGGIPTGWSHIMKNSELGGDGDAIYSQYSLPKGIDTSLPLYIDVVMNSHTTGTGQGIDFIGSVKIAEVQGVQEADPTGGITPVARTLANTATVTASAGQSDAITVDDTNSGKIFKVEFGPFDISDFYEGDCIFVRIELDDDGTGASNIGIIEVGVTAVKWNHGGKL